MLSRKKKKIRTTILTTNYRPYICWQLFSNSPLLPTAKINKQGLRHPDNNVEKISKPCQTTNYN